MIDQDRGMTLYMTKPLSNIVMAARRRGRFIGLGLCIFTLQPQRIWAML